MKILLVEDKSAENLILCVYVVETWLRQYGHTLVQLRQDAGSTENCTALQTSLGHIAVENSASAAPEHQQANPAERTIQPFIQQFRILLGSSYNFSPKEWGVAVLATEYHFGGTMGSKARHISEGLQTRNQLIT